MVCVGGRPWTAGLYNLYVTRFRTYKLIVTVKRPKFDILFGENIFFSLKSF
jgi:hypothetical protein